MKSRSLLLLLLISATLGAALTGFYFVHESLPRAIRAPTSLILALVAAVDGLCYGIGERDRLLIDEQFLEGKGHWCRLKARK